ncbi:class I SAM-dependent methyltransferase [Alphaproteobacteria bacterium]|nr:class I SAM-dependent methyltransferase [Alphaproteobacteria bacterium]
MPDNKMISALRPAFWQKAKLYVRTPIIVLTGKVVRKFFAILVEAFYLPKLNAEFRDLKLGSHGLQKCIYSLEFSSVLDVGSGEGIHASLFRGRGKMVTAIDYGGSEYFKNRRGGINEIVGDFNTHNFSETFDLVWCCHVLEHQPNVGIFLKKIFDVLSINGYLAITVPPSRNTIVGGHVSNWNAGLLIYNLILAGFNCKECNILKYGYNITVIVQKKGDRPELKSLSFDAGDLRLLRPQLPERRFYSNDIDDPFFGEIWRHNW